LLGAFSLSTWLFQDYTILTLKSKEKEAENTVQDLEFHNRVKSSAIFESCLAISQR